MLHIFDNVLLNSILVCGLVIVMMMLIECFNVWSKGRFVGAFRGRGLGQIVLAAALGTLPGCMGGFAAVSLYTHGMLSFGALVAMMIASSGDESFVMLAMIPDVAWKVFLGLFALAVAVGVAVDLIHKPSAGAVCSCENFQVHGDEAAGGKVRHFGWKRLVMFVGVAAFLAALVLGVLEHSDGPSEIGEVSGGINLLSEDWMNVMFAIFGLAVLGVLLFAGDHFVEEHLWHHIVCEHLPKIFAWTAGALAVIALLLHFVDLGAWVSENVLLMIVLAALVGIIPESGPHMLFVTLYASGLAPLSVLVASCISQDGHAGLPLLAENRGAFVKAKIVNCVVAVGAGVLVWLAFGR